MDFRLLGPLAVLHEGADVTPRRAQQRVVLAVLLLRRNRVVPADDLIDALWRDEPPDTAQTALQGHVSALRKVLGPKRIETRAPGYLLRVESGELDVERFERSLAEARAAREAARRLELARQALELWRGEPLVEFRDEPFARSEISSLEALHISAIEERMQAEIDLGRHDSVLAELDRQVRAEPLRERLRGQLMLALYRAGRDADALSVYQEGRKAASEQLGLDPGASLQALERQILAHDPALELRAPSAAPEQARKIVSVLVAEIIGSSNDPEEAERLGPVLARSRSLIESFGASVEPLFSNALLAVFGARRAHEDDAERAVRAALAIRDTVDGTRALSARVGVDSGPALVTITGDRVDVAGRVLTEASRLHAGARSGSVVVSDAVRATTITAIAYEPLADGAWRAIDPHETVPTRHADIADVPFVGRGAELAVLERARERVTEGVAQLITLVGEAGAGKTRLVREFLERQAHTSITSREGRCLPYGEGITLWALAEIVKEEAGITESDDPGSSARKLRRSIESLVSDAEERVWLETGLAALAGISVTQGGDRAQLFAAARRFIETMAWRSPLVLVFEDLQWADASLLDFVETLPTGVPGSSLLVIATARPELLDSRPQWSGGIRNASTVSLRPLDQEETRAIARSVIASVPEELVRRAGGNPLFTLELARIVGSGSHEVPGSISAVIAARLDSLPADARATATDAAVVGEVFWPGAVAAVAGMNEREVLERLGRLSTNDFVRRQRASSVRGQEQYAFMHALTRDVAYERVPHRQLSRKHEAAAQWIERLAAGRESDHAELIAHHYGAALRYVDPASEGAAALRGKATYFLRIAADRALGFDVDAADRLYRRALELASDDDAERPMLLAGLATATQDSGRVNESVILYEEAIAGLDAQQAAQGAAHARLELARALWNAGQTERHRRLVDEAITLLERSAMSPDLARAWLLKGRDLLMQGGDARACLDWMARSIAAAEEVGALAVKVRSMQFRGLSRWELGDQHAGVADLEEALRLGRDGGVGFETAMCYSNLAEVVARRDGPAKGLPVLREGIEFAERRGLIFAAMWMRATEPLLLFETGAWDEVIDRGDFVMAWDRSRGTTQITRIILSLKVEILVDRGQLPEAAVLAEELLPMARQTGDVQALMEALPAVARLAIARGDLSAARDLIAQARDASARNPAWRSHRIADCVRSAIDAGDVELARSLLSSVDVQVPRAHAAVLSARAAYAEAIGERAQAIGLYEDASARWREFGHRVELGHTLLGLGRTLRSLGRTGEAIAALAEARRIFGEMNATALVAVVDAIRSDAQLVASSEQGAS